MSAGDEDDVHPYILEPSDVPFAGPDPDSWGKELKQDNIADAESVVEADINDGRHIDNPTRIHRLAVNVFATFLYATGPESPESITAADFADDDGGEGYTDPLLNLYDRLVDSINSSEADEGKDVEDERRRQRKAYTTHRRGEYADDNRPHPPNERRGTAERKH
jgi:hypothetical protein